MIPNISVLMPVYNAEKYLGDAVDSILSQTFRDFEFIIIDDGSTDRSLEILRRYEKREPRIRLISRPNTGYVIALNEMLALAKGEFVARMDADDISLPERFEKQVAFLRDHREVVCVGTQFESIDEEGRVFARSNYPADPTEIDRQHMGNGYCLLHPTWMVRRHAFERWGGYSTECYPAEDNDMLLKFGEVGLLSNVDEVLFRYRILSSSVSSGNRHLQWQGGNLALTRAWHRRGMSGDPPISNAPPVGERFAGDARGLTSRGWIAWTNGYVDSARVYAHRAVRKSPLTGDTWKLLICAWLKNAKTKRWLA